MSGMAIGKPGGSGGGGGSGDVTDVLAGTGITVTNPGGPQPSVALSAGSQAADAAALSALQPITGTAGLLKTTALGAASALANGAEGTILRIVSGVPAWSTQMAIEYTQSALTVSTTPVSLSNGGTVIQTRTGAGARYLKVDTANMAAGDQYRFSVHEKAVAGGTQRKTEIAVLTGAQVGLFFAGPYPLSDGWDFSAEKLAGTDRAFDVEILVGGA